MAETGAGGEDNSLLVLPDSPDAVTGGSGGSGGSGGLFGNGGWGGRGGSVFIQRGTAAAVPVATGETASWAATAAPGVLLSLARQTSPTMRPARRSGGPADGAVRRSASGAGGVGGGGGAAQVLSGEAVGGAGGAGGDGGPLRVLGAREVTAAERRPWEWTRSRAPRLAVPAALADARRREPEAMAAMAVSARCPFPEPRSAVMGVPAVRVSKEVPEEQEDWAASVIEYSPQGSPW